MNIIKKHNVLYLFILHYGTSYKFNDNFKLIMNNDLIFKQYPQLRKYK